MKVILDTHTFLWYAEGQRWSFSAEDSEATGVVGEHPAPKLSTSPVTLLFEGGPGGTYPLWFDPAHWYKTTPSRYGLKFVSLPSSHFTTLRVGVPKPSRMSAPRRGAPQLPA